ncbi:MAG: DNA repair protein RecO [Gemmatales bacterium]|nr:DNA repair protein RecO [Gemmatales bacterium]MDW8386516.1 DNA repair protein RecO [Gemmatales bacterium]
MSSEKATALVLRTTDYSETSRIATLWTREFGKVRALAKGGRRLRSNFESALDLLTVASIVLLRKSSGSLDLLVEARVLERFPRLARDLKALYAAYYLAELLGDWTQENDPHPLLFDEAVDALRTFGSPDVPTATRLLRFETVLLRELGYAPQMEMCAVCRTPIPSSRRGETTGENRMAFSPAAGGLVCGECQSGRRGLIPVTRSAWEALRLLESEDASEAWKRIGEAEQKELRGLFNQYICYLLGRRPRTMRYLGE